MKEPEIQSRWSSRKNKKFFPVSNGNHSEIFFQILRTWSNHYSRHYVHPCARFIIRIYMIYNRFVNLFLFRMVFFVDFPSPRKSKSPSDLPERTWMSVIAINGWIVPLKEHLPLGIFICMLPLELFNNTFFVCRSFIALNSRFFPRFPSPNNSSDRYWWGPLRVRRTHAERGLRWLSRFRSWNNRNFHFYCNFSEIKGNARAQICSPGNDIICG